MPMDKNFDAATAEAALSQKWEAAGAFKAGANARAGAETFCIMIPPPNVTGSLHMGHAFNNTLQDILIRWHRMRGHDTLWQPGQDHAGIATQMVVERELARTQQPSRTEMGREAFLEKVWEWKEQSGGTIVNQLKRLGASCDWSRNRFTMDEGFHDAVLKVFVDMYNKGFIYRGKRLVNWDPHFETAISDLEVENIEVAGHMWHCKYPLAGGETYEYVEKDEDGNVTLREVRDYISIATTRPETMLGDGAVAVHPDDARYASIVGKLCEIPVGPKQHRRLIPIITDEYPDMNFGSGAVKITGAHDFNDYAVAKRGNIPCYRLMDTKGAMRSDGAPYGDEAAKAQAIVDGKDFTEAEVDAINLVPDEYRGLDRFDARCKVVADITAEGLAVMVATTPEAEGDAAPAPAPGPEGQEVPQKVPEQVRDSAVLVPYVENKPIMQPFGDRSKVVIEPMLTDQWFVDAAKIVQPAIDAVRNGDTKILPESDAKVYFHWLENIEPWCISRQLWWGHQIPVWYGPQMRENDDLWSTEDGTRADGWASFCGASEAEAEILAREFYGMSDRYKEPEFRFHPDKQTAMLEGVKTLGNDSVIHMFRDPDVLDTWFSSGLWPIGTLGWPEQTPELQKYFPTSVLITGFDIIFFWVARMMMMQLAVVDQVPFHTVYVHALVRDENGKKMSKSLGNVLDPLELIDEYGADAVRFTVTAMAAMGRDLKLSTSRIAGYRNFGTKLWNAARFAEMNDCKPSADFDPTKVNQTVNKWIIGETARVRESVDTSLEQFRFNDAANALYAHVWGKVCDWYVELAKPLFQGDDAAAKAETQATMAWAIDQCLILLHPIMPFITEQLWGDIAPRAKLLVHADWPQYGAELIDPAADREMNWVIALIDQIRSVRQSMHVPAGAKVPMIKLEIDAAGQAALDGNLAMILRLARIETLTVATEAPKGAVTLAVEGGTFCLPLANVIDIESEKARLQKTLDKLGKEAGGLNAKLANQKFLANAPEDIVQIQRDRLAAIDEETGILQAAFQRIAALG
ncbi:MAG: valine--tRNA ligase [Proteobacteria bacterium]|nr:valine--tRNA ligase [Pseudomonadota bacterium]MDA1287601.1 valine--tRNA ligase [Pseudomonadota bacterium]